MFGETIISQGKVWNHPTETTILKCIFRVPDGANLLNFRGADPTNQTMREFLRRVDFFGKLENSNGIWTRFLHGDFLVGDDFLGKIFVPPQKIDRYFCFPIFWVGWDRRRGKKGVGEMQYSSDFTWVNGIHHKMSNRFGIEQPKVEKKHSLANSLVGSIQIYMCYPPEV